MVIIHKLQQLELTCHPYEGREGTLWPAMFSTVCAGLCILVQIHLSLFSPSCQTQGSQRSSTAPCCHGESPVRPCLRWESHRLGKLRFYIRLQGSTWVCEQTHWTACLWALPCFSPCHAQGGPSLCSGAERGRAWCCDTISWFWNTAEKKKECFKETRQGTRHHAATMSWQSSLLTPSGHGRSHVSQQRGAWEKIHTEPEPLKRGMCHLIEHTFVPLNTIIQPNAPRGTRREFVVTMSGLNRCFGDLWTDSLNSQGL